MQKGSFQMRRLNIIIGSMGSYEPIREILSELPADYSFPVIVAVHREQYASARMSVALSLYCALQVREIEDKDSIEPGTVFLAPSGYHLLIDDNRMALSTCPQEGYGVPSFDLLLQSAADAYRSGVCCVVLSGANDDGSKGAKQVYEKLGMVLVQDPGEAEHLVMPQAAIKKVPSAKVMGVKAIGRFLAQMSDDSR